MKQRLVILLCACCGVAANARALPEVIDNSVYPPSAMPAHNVNVAPSPSTSTLIDMTGRLEQLQTEVQQLTGKVEEQANTIAELKKQQKARFTDIDERLQAIESKASGTEQPAAEAGTDTAPPAAEPAGTPPPAPAPEAAATPAAATPPAAVQASDAEKQDYQAAYLALRKGHTDESVTAFKSYLSNYPNGGFASNAQYWLGEAYLVKKDNDAARAAFNTVLEKYSGSAKAADALLMLGKIEMDQKNTDKARDYFTRVTTNFPNTTAALAAAKKLLMLNAASQ
jgi:tol-pal system protein YbgF